ncbi:MAG: bifunctional glutamate N-acetyltransferase/amino-acid acetyltransferase ArgJ [Gammaproteobacteria bacterium]|nr:bifunctional glutamate N-acetyltransferase/amino-acid acetyltransferase ArgJ [Gammaproteobacteria bacterium]
MPVNLTLPPAVPVSGVQLATVAAGIKKDGSPDLVLVQLAAESTVAGVFTQNHFAAAPVQIARQHLEQTQGAVRAYLINSGNANAGTGSEGAKITTGHCAAVADALQLDSQQVLPFSTGVIGEQLPDEKIRQGIRQAAGLLGDDWRSAARGIMTTDTVPKISSRQIDISGTPITITGFVKGAGMIQPNMATMLAYFFTDAAIDAADLSQALRKAVANSFNVVTVDSDTSTNDACVLAATGQSIPLSAASDHWPDFQRTLNELMLELAQALVRDGEGATKFITVKVNGASSEDEAKEVAFAVANSPLVKTALFASDANIGRLLMAIGKVSVQGIDQNKVKVALGDNAELTLFEHGVIAPSYTEAQGSAVFARDEIGIVIDLAMGQAGATVYTSDLSHDYVSINADYRS